MDRLIRSRFLRVFVFSCLAVPAVTVALADPPATAPAGSAPSAQASATKLAPESPSRNLTLTLYPDAIEEEARASARPIGPEDDPAAYVYRCPSADMELCFKLVNRQQFGEDPVTGRPAYEWPVVTISPLTFRVKTLPDMVLVTANSFDLCGMWSCPQILLRRTGPASWVQVLDDRGMETTTMEMPGQARPWFNVDVHMTAVETLTDVHKPFGGRWLNVVNEIVDFYPDHLRDRFIATPAGIRYATRLCPNLASPSDHPDNVPEFSSRTFSSNVDFVFSTLDGECDGWPQFDDFNQVFIIFDRDGGNVPVSWGQGFGWRGVGANQWMVFTGHLLNWDDEEAIVEALAPADAIEPPPVCGLEGCHRALRWLAPGIVAIDWYRQTSRPSHAVRSDMFLLPQTVSLTPFR